MESFTVSIPGYRITYEYKSFHARFPESMIMAALQSGESEVPLSNPIITPEVLRLLQAILSADKHPYIDITFRKALDYLGIDVPPVVYDPKYKEFLQIHPDLDINKTEYRHLLEVSRSMNFLGLATYLFETTDPDVHKSTDHQMFSRILDMKDFSLIDMDLGVLLLDSRGLSKIYKAGVGAGFDFKTILKHRLLPVLQAYLRTVTPGNYITYIVNEIVNQIWFRGFDAEKDPQMLRMAMASPLPDKLRNLGKLVLSVSQGELQEYTPDERYDTVLIYVALVQGHYDIARMIYDAYVEMVLRTHQSEMFDEFFDEFYDILYGRYIRNGQHDITFQGIRFMMEMTQVLKSGQAQRDILQQVKTTS